MTASMPTLTGSQSDLYAGRIAPFCFGRLIPTTIDTATNMVDFTISPSPAPISPVARTIRYAVEHYDDLLRRLAD